jgi:murein DD-endopeptidase MepM/ murein hydrolase activator NlpD
MSSSPPAVPKPASPGASKTALIITRSAYVNIRNGPGTQYLDIGDILNNSVVTYYPSTQTSDGWVWLEQRNLAGWVASYVVTFEELNAPPPTASKDPTPYDGAVAIWHWKGDVVPENSIDDLARNIKLAAPHVTDLFVKTSDYTPSSGARWQGQWDTKRALAIDGPDSIDRWVQILGRYGLGFHAWCVPRGLDVAGETNLIIQACQRPGVKSMILDIEPYEGFWSAGKAGIRPFMTAIRRAIPGSFHIGMSVDPRSHHYASIFPDEWFPFVNSIHPQTYWTTFRVTPEHALAEAYRVWAGFGKPIIPVLQGDSPAAEMSTGHTLSVQKHHAPGVAWWRLGVISAVGWRSINQPVTPGAPPPDPGTEVPPSQYGDEFVIRPGQTGFANGSYTGQQEFRTFLGTWGWDVYYKNTEARQSKVWAQWTPSLKRSGKYEVATFVPNRRATTTRARYKIHGVVGANGEMVVEVDQSRHKNQWVTLGVFDFDRNAPNGGSIFLNDLTYEDDKSIAFDAIRWREVVSGGQPGPGGYVADGYDSPVGTLAERRGTAVWPGRWYDASPFGRLYFIGTPNEAYHTGADLNLPSDADAHSPVYASASGVVTFASRLATWGNVIVIRHDPLATNGRVLYSRSAHVESMLVKVGQRVSRGERIASVGNAFGQWAYHLHFDLSPTTILESQPQHWPARNQTALLQNYIDPKAFILANRPR